MGGAIGNEGFDIVFYLALMVPLEYLLTSRRVVADGNRRKAAMIAGGVLAAVSAVKLGLEMAHKAPSYYDKLEVMPTANHAEIKKGYRAAAQKVHPDKLQAAGEDEDGDEAFVELKKAYDVLTDSALRDLYQKFGPDGLEYQTDTSKLMAGLGFFYVVWITVAYLLTRRKSVGAAQTWTFTGLLALGIFEYQASIVGVDFAEEFLPQLALFERIELLHRLYPVYLLGARIVAWMNYEDLETLNAFRLQHLHARTEAPTQWRLADALAEMALPGGELPHHLQRRLARPVHTANARRTAARSAETRAHLQGCQSPWASGWLQAVPRHPDVALLNAEFSFAWRDRLGLDRVGAERPCPRQCRNGLGVLDAAGYHLWSCPRGAGCRTLRHDLVRDGLAHALRWMVWAAARDAQAAPRRAAPARGARRPPARSPSVPELPTEIAARFSSARAEDRDEESAGGTGGAPVRCCRLDRIGCFPAQRRPRRGPPCSR